MAILDEEEQVIDNSQIAPEQIVPVNTPDVVPQEQVPVSIREQEIKTPVEDIREPQGQQTSIVKNIADYQVEIDEAIGSGTSIRRVAELFVQGTGMSVEETENNLIKTYQTKVSDLKDEGLSREDIDKVLENRNYNLETRERILEKFKRPSVIDRLRKYEYNPRNTATEDIQNIADNYKNIYGKYSTGAKSIVGTLGGLSSKAASLSFGEAEGVQARRDINQLNLDITTKLVDEGFDAYINSQTGDVMYKDENGREQVLDSSILNDLINGKFEIISAIGGGVVGAKSLAPKLAVGGAVVGGVVGAKFGGSVGAKAGVKIGSKVGSGIGTGIGMATGAGLGRGGDIMLNSFLLKEDIEADLYITQMKEAAIFDVATGILGSAAIRTSKSLGKASMKAYNFVVQGNSEGAYKFLLDSLLMNKEQAGEFIKQYEKVTGTSKGFGKDINAYNIDIIARTHKGAEGAVLQAVSKDSKASNQLIKGIDDSVKELRRAVQEVKGDDVGKLIRNDLDTYVKDVNEFFGATEDILVDAASGTDFAYDVDKLGITKVLNFITKKKTTKGVNAAAQLDSVDLAEVGITDALQDKSIKGLLELRKSINSFKFSGTKFQRPDMDIINGVINNVDRQIEKAALDHIPNGKEWIQQFKKAKESFSTMKKLEKNTFFTALTKNRGLVTEDSIENAFSKSIDTLNDTFLDVVKHLPPSTREKAEGAIINRHFKNSTFGDISGIEVTDFPKLSDKLRGVSLESPRGKALNKYIDEIGRIYKNNVNLAGSTGQIALPNRSVPLHQTAVGKLRMSALNFVWQEVKALAPTKLNAGRSLIKQLEKVLESPTHVSTVDKFISQLPKASREGAISLVKELQVEMAKSPKKPPSDFKNMFKQSKSGKFTITDGALGKGVYLVDKVKNPNPASKIIKQEVNMSRMATLDTISNLVGRPVTAKEVRDIPNLQRQLSDRGYNGIVTEGRAMLFPEQSFKKTIEVP